MKYRRLTEDWDFQLGHGISDYWSDRPEGVLQGVLTRLKLLKGEWFNDTSEGMPWRDDVLGKDTRTKYDMAIRRRILGSMGVKSIVDYASNFDSEERQITVSATLETIYGQAVLEGVL